NCSRHVFSPQRLVSPLHVRSDRFDGPARKKRFREKMTSILLPGRDDQGNVAVPGILNSGKSIAGAGNRMQIYEGGLSRAHRVSQSHASGNALVESQNVFEIRGHVAQVRKFGWAG